jgi:NitT/TauT family transport system substrate-binding protein
MFLRFKPWLRLSFLPLLWLGWLAAPAFPAEPKTDPRALSPVKLGIATRATDFFPYFIAKEKGFYAEEGLDVITVFISPPTGILAMANGDLQFNAAIGSGTRAAIMGSPVRPILALNRGPQFWLMAHPSIKSMEELVGHTIASGFPGSTTHVYTLYILERFGLKGKVQVLAAGQGGREAALNLISGKVMATYANSDSFGQLVDKGFRQLVKFTDYIGQPTSGIVTSQNLIQTRPEMVQSFVNASYRAMAFFKKNRAESIQLLAKFQGKDEKSATRVYDLEIGNFGGDGTLHCETAKKELVIQKDFLKPQAPPACDVLLDNRFAQKIPRHLIVQD